MFNSVIWHIALRYIRSKRRNGFIAFVSLFALIGMTLGVFALVVVLSVMNGFDSELKNRILRVVPHAFITTRSPLAKWPELAEKIVATPHLQAAAPYIEGKGLIVWESSVRALEIQGVDPGLEAGVSEIAQSMLIGELNSLTDGGYGIVLGSLIARNLGVSTGDKISLTLPVVSITPAGVFPRSKRFTVVGVFEVGAQIDQSLALIHIADAQKLFRLPDQVHGLRLRFDDIYQAPQYLRALVSSLGDHYTGKDWSETQGSLFQAVKMEKTVVGLMLGVIIAIAAFNIVTSLIMMVTEKRGDIAVLRTLGLTRQGIIQVFMIQGTLMGAIGVLVGAVLGVLVAQYLGDIMRLAETLFGFEVFDQDVYFVTYLPSEWRLSDTLWICTSSLFISFLATIYPSYRASLIAPAEALRYEI